MSSDKIETETEIVAGKHLCIYCGEECEIETRGGGHNNDYEEYPVCDCKESFLAKELHTAMSIAADKMKILKEGKGKEKINIMKYYIDLEQLRHRYGIKELA